MDLDSNKLFHISIWTTLRNLNTTRIFENIKEVFLFLSMITSWLCFLTGVNLEVHTYCQRMISGINFRIMHWREYK